MDKISLQYIAGLIDGSGDLVLERTIDKYGVPRVNRLLEINLGKTREAGRILKKLQLQLGGIGSVTHRENTLKFSTRANIAKALSQVIPFLYIKYSRAKWLLSECGLTNSEKPLSTTIEESNRHIELFKQAIDGDDFDYSELSFPAREWWAGLIDSAGFITILPKTFAVKVVVPLKVSSVTKYLTSSELSYFTQFSNYMLIKQHTSIKEFLEKIYPHILVKTQLVDLALERLNLCSSLKFGLSQYDDMLRIYNKVKPLRFENY